MIEAKKLRDSDFLKTIPNDKPGYYKWWASKAEFDTILNSLGVRYDDIAADVLQKDGLYCIYVGIAVNESIRKRLDWHVNDKHTASKVKNGTLSTLRQSISSIVAHNQYDKEATDVFIDQLMIEYWTLEKPIHSSEAKEEIERTEKDAMKENLYILNIRGNKYSDFAKVIKKKLSKLRTESKMIMR